MLVLLLLATLSAAQIAPRQPGALQGQPAGQMPPRDAAPAREGNAVIRGRVTAADTGLPLRRAFVTLMGISSSGPPGTIGPGSGSRSVATDLDGRFAFTRLPAGTYRLRVAPGAYRAQYLAIAYGGKRQQDSGQPIELKDGQRFEQADVALPRGGAITGRVIDEFGEPVTRAGVYTSKVMPGGTSFQRSGGFNQTDDFGRFRLYGLEPGEYIVAAEARGMGGPPLEGGSEGFVTTYAPSTLTEREAGRIRVIGAADAGDVEIQLVRTRTFQITGIVMDSQGRVISRPNASLVRGTTTSGFSSFGMSADQTGKFTIRDVVPGEYRLVVRPGNMGPPQEQPQTPQRSEYANIPVSVSADIENLVVVTQPGTSITGHVVFAEGTPPNPPSGLRVMTQPAERMMMMGSAPTASVGANLQFTLNELFGTHFLRVIGLPPGHALKAVMLGQTDITDSPVEFKPEHNKQLQIVVTSRASTLEGIVTDDNGEPATETLILMIPEDKTSWRMGSSRMRTTGILKAGQFSVSGVLPGRYHVIALPRDRFYPNPDLGADFFEPLTKEATTVVIGEDEKRTVDLRVTKPPQEF